MVLPISPIVRRHSTVQKRASFKDARDIQPALKLALRAANESAAAAAASSSSSRSSSIAIATSSTHSAAPSSHSPNVASSSSVNRVTSTTSTTSSATTSTSTSVTHPEAVTTSSTSASSSVSSSSSQVSSASTVPGTTFIAGPFATPTPITTYIPPTVITTTSSVPTTSPSTTSAPKSFLANTGAAAAVFTAVGLVGLALLIMAISFLIKRHRRAQSQDDDEYFEKIVTSHSYDNSGATGSRGLASLDPVHLSHANDMYNAHGGGNYAYTPQDYGIEYPPGTSYTSSQEHANSYNTPGARGPDSQAALDPFDDPFGSQMPSRIAAANVSNPRGPYEPSDPYY